MRRRRAKPRRGIAIILVLAMVSIALAVSYAMIRTQMTTSQIQTNSDRRTQSRNAAMTGLANGIRKMHLNSWGGVGTTLSGTLNAYDTYTVTYTAGDSSLTTSSPNYFDWHRRVTVIATGKSVSPTNSQVSSTHQAKAVVQLVPRALGAQPTNWSQVSSYSLYQTGNGQFTMQVPGRVEGALRLQGSVQLGNVLNWSSAARSRYFTDLNAMRSGHNEVQSVTVTGGGGQFRLRFNGATTNNLNHNASASTVRIALRALATIGGANVDVTGSNGGPYTVTFVGSLGNQDLPQMSAQDVSLSGSNAGVSVSLVTQGNAGYPDCRPIVGPVSLPVTATDSTNLNLLAALGVATTNIGVSTSMNLSLPNSLSTYRIYTGGPTYLVPQVSSNLSNTTLAPNPTTNPLGIYFCGSSLTLGNNVNMMGTLITGSGLTVSGNGVVAQSASLWPLAGSSTPVRLPTLVSRQNLRVDTGSVSATVSGAVLVGQQFLLDEGDEDATFSLTGRLVTNEFVLKRRDEWNYSSTIWSVYYSLFNSQLSNSECIPFYPIYLAYAGRSPNPTLTLKPDPSSLTDHWQNLDNPIYVAHSSDPGLKWDVVRMEMGE